MLEKRSPSTTLAKIVSLLVLLQDSSSSLDLRTSTAVESLLSLRGSCGASGSARMECQWRPPSPAPSTSSERSVAPGASPVRQDATATPQPSSVRPAFQPPSSATHYSPPPPFGGYTLGPDGHVVNSYPQPSYSPPSIVSRSLSLSLSLPSSVLVGCVKGGNEARETGNRLCLRPVTKKGISLTFFIVALRNKYCVTAFP